VWLQQFNAATRWEGSTSSTREWLRAGLHWQAAGATESTLEPEDRWTRSEGFPLMVLPMQQERIAVYRGQPDVQVGSDGKQLVLIRTDAFAHADMQAQVELKLSLADGGSLPGWMRFNGKTGQLLVDAPQGLHAELVLKLTATDQEGAQASTVFRIHIQDNEKTGTGRPSLSQKLQNAAAHRLAAVLPGMGVLFKHG
jgi:hypothetical protein